MNNGGRKVLISRICRPYGARSDGGVPSTKMPLLTELGEATKRRTKIAHGLSRGSGCVEILEPRRSDRKPAFISLFHENNGRLLKQF